MLEAVLEVAVEARDIGARATHVEADDPREPATPSRRGGPDHATGGTAEQGVGCVGGVSAHQAPRAGHDVQRPSAPGEGLAHPVQIIPDGPGEVCVDHRRLSPRQDLDQGGQIRGAGDMIEAGRREQLRHAPLVGGVAVAVNQGDGGGPDPPSAQDLGPPGQVVKVQRHHDGPVGGHSLVDLLHRLIQRRRLQDTQGKEVRPLLVTDRKQIAETPCDEQRSRRARSLKQGIRAPGRGQPHREGGQRSLGGRPRHHPRRDDRCLVVGPYLERRATTQSRRFRQRSLQLDHRRRGIEAGHGNGLVVDPEKAKPEAADEVVCNSPLLLDPDPQAFQPLEHATAEGAR